jgi:hypothetical protein
MKQYLEMVTKKKGVSAADHQPKTKINAAADEIYSARYS